MANYWFNDIRNVKADIIRTQQQYTQLIQSSPPAWSTLQKVPFQVLMKLLIKQKDKWDQERDILQKKADHLQHSDPTKAQLCYAIRAFKADRINFQIYSQMEDQIIEIEEYLTMKDSDQHSYKKNITKQNDRIKQESTTKVQSTEQEWTIEHHTAANIQSAIELQFVSTQVNDYPILQQNNITAQEFATVIQSAIERQPVRNEQIDYPITEQQHYIHQPTATDTPTFQSKCSQQFISTHVPPLNINQLTGDYSEWNDFWQIFNAAAHEQNYPNVSNFIALCSNLDGRALYEIMKNAMKQSLGRKFLDFNELSTFMGEKVTMYKICPITYLHAKETTVFQPTNFISPSTESTLPTPESDFYIDDLSYMLLIAVVGERIAERYCEYAEHLNKSKKLLSIHYLNFLRDAKQRLPITTCLNQLRGKCKSTKITNFIKNSDYNSTDIHYTDDFTTRHDVRYISSIKQASSSCWWPECHDDS